MDYKNINALIFWVVGPALFTASVVLNIVLAIKLASLGK